MGHQLVITRIPVKSLIAPLGPEGGALMETLGDAFRKLPAAEVLAASIERDGMESTQQDALESLAGVTPFEGWDHSAGELPNRLGQLAEHGGDVLRFLRYRPSREDMKAHLERLAPALHRLALNPTVIVLAPEEIRSLRWVASKRPADEAWVTEWFPNLARTPEDDVVDLLQMFADGEPPLDIGTLPKTRGNEPWPPSRRVPSRAPSHDFTAWNFWAVTALVVAVGWLVPAYVFFATLSESARMSEVAVGGFLALGLLWSSVEYRGRDGAVVPWRVRALHFVGGPVVLALVLAAWRFGRR